MSVLGVILDEPGWTGWRCHRCGAPMYREDNGPQEAWHCPDRHSHGRGERVDAPTFEAMSGEPGWAVIVSDPSGEDLAAKSILAEGYRSYLPRYRKQLTRRMDPLTGRMISTRHGGDVVSRPLFTGYLFAELHPNQQWRPIVEARGVQRILKRGDRPDLLSGEIIEAMRFVEEDGEFDEIREAKEIRPDLKNLLAQGVIPLVRVPQYGVVAKLIGMDEKGRARVLMEWLGRGEVRTTVQAETLMVVGAP